jgi:steroid delta-isomerase-like uncharacterized protein
MMPDTIGIARELIDAFNAGDGERFKNNLTTDAVYDEVATGRKVQGRDACVQSWQEWRRAMPDAKGKVTNAVTSGNTVVLEITWEGSQTGPLTTVTGQNLPPSGRRQVTRATQILVFEGDKVKETRHYFDCLNLLQQLGAIPQTQTTRVSGTSGA